MMFFQTVRTAINALRINKLRSFLTILGVVIGVSAVVAMMAMGEGAKAKISDSFASMGTNMLIIMPGSSDHGGQRGGFGSQPTLTWDDLDAIQREVPTVAYAAAQLRTNAQIVSSEQNWSTSIVGTSPDYFNIRSWNADNGTLFSQQDVDGGNKVVILGATVADNLFSPDVDPLGQTVRIRNTPFIVIGILAKKGQSAFGQDYDDTAFIPQSAFQTKISGGLDKYLQGSIMVSANSADAVAATQDQITALLRERHQLSEEAEDDFNVRNLAEAAGAQQEGVQTMTLLLASIAAVSLLVGGIGVMNIMLVSVTERTREIGLRMAVGAKPHHILSQFLIEAVALSLTGGILGILLGIVAAQQLAMRFGWPTMFRPEVALLAIGFSAAVGVGFGLYPAQKASRLNPIDALRFE